MDETTYSQPEIIELINERFVPVRVDNDRRPDVNARYNQGGWPTTAFLNADGSLLAGATYIPPAQMLPALERIAQFHDENGEQIAARALEMRAKLNVRSNVPASPLNEVMIVNVLAQIEAQYDPEYGGFGDAPKFPVTDALEFLLQEYLVTKEQRIYDMLARTLLGMSGGGMYDHVEGGFFRYSTTRDWSVPHFEKMSEDHAGLLRVLAGLTRISRIDAFHSTLLSATRWVRTVLRDPSSGFFGGSQDADEAYYALPLEERQAVTPPYVDRTAYSNWNASLAGALLSVAAVLEDEAIAGEGIAALDALHHRMRDEAGLLHHYIEPGGTPRVRGLLVDQAEYLRALIDAHEFTAQSRFLDRAAALATAIERHFSGDDGSLLDRADFEATLGNLAFEHRPLPENALIAECFLRLADLQSDPAYRAKAERILRPQINALERSGIFAATLARALRHFLATPAYVALVGTPEETSAFRESARNLPEPMLALRTIDPVDAATLVSRGFDPALHPAAYVCRAQACAAPVRSAGDIRRAYESLAPA